MCREKPQQILHYHVKKAKEMYSRLKEVYDDPGIPPEADCLIRVRRAGTTCSQSTGMTSGAA